MNNTKSEESELFTPVVLAEQVFSDKKSFVYNKKVVEHASIKSESKNQNDEIPEKGLIQLKEKSKRESRFNAKRLKTLKKITNEILSDPELRIISSLIFSLILFILFLEGRRTSHFEYCKGANEKGANLNANEKEYYHKENGEIEEITKMSIDGETIFSRKNYNFDKKVDVTVRGSTLMGKTKFLFYKDANLTVIGSTYMGSTTFEGHGKLNVNFIRSTFMGKFTAIFHEDGVLNCQWTTFMGPTTFDHGGEIQKDVTNCVFMASNKF